MSTPIMRRSRVLQQLRSGAIVHSIKLNFADARIAEMAALSGIDCIWTDMEHVANDWTIIENQIRAAKVHDTDTTVRVARGSYSDYIRPLELDAAGIMVPHVKSAAEAEEIVRAVKFHPIGLRPVDGGNADGSYCLYIKTKPLLTMEWLLCSFLGLNVLGVTRNTGKYFVDSSLTQGISINIVPETDCKWEAKCIQSAKYRKS